METNWMKIYSARDGPFVKKGPEIYYHYLGFKHKYNYGKMDNI